MSRIASVELSSFGFEVEGLGLPAHGAAGVGNVIAQKGDRMPAQRWAVRIETDDGARGEYVTHWVGTPSSFAQAADAGAASARAAIRTRARRSGRTSGARSAPTTTWATVRSTSRSGTSRASAAMSRLRACSAASARGCRPMPAPITARMSPAGSIRPQAFADYAAACKQRGFAGFKIHGWHDGDVAARDRQRARRARGRRRRLAADARPRLAAADLDGRALCRAGLRRGRVLLVRGPLSRHRRRGRRAQAPARAARRRRCWSASTCAGSRRRRRSCSAAAAT